MNNNTIAEILRADGWNIIGGIPGYHWYFRHKEKPGIVMVQLQLEDLWNLHIKTIEKSSTVKLCNDTASLTLTECEFLPVPCDYGKSGMNYWALFNHAEEKSGGFVVTFPDLPGCVTQGNSFAEALDNATYAQNGYLAVLQQNGEPIPKASDYVEAKAKAEAEAKKSGEALHPQAQFQAVPAHALEQVTRYRD